MSFDEVIKNAEKSLSKSDVSLKEEIGELEDEDTHKEDEKQGLKPENTEKTQKTEIKTEKREINKENNIQTQVEIPDFSQFFSKKTLNKELKKDEVIRNAEKTLTEQEEE